MGNSSADKNLFSQYKFAKNLEILSSTEQNNIEALRIPWKSQYGRDTAGNQY